MTRIARTAAALMALTLCLPPAATAAGYVMTYAFGGTPAIYRANVEKTDGALNCVSPSWFDLNPDGSLNARGLDRELIEFLRGQKIEVTPFLSNHWDKASGNAALNNIEPLTDALAAVVLEYHLDGVNVDIQNVNEAFRDKYTQFVRRLKEKLPDKIISVAVAANPNGWTLGWHGSYDYAALGEVSDYLMLMAYDESYFDSAPGPVASASFVERSIQYALKRVPADKLVLGVPYYGRYWKHGAEAGGYAIVMRDVEHLLQSMHPTVRIYDEAAQSVRVDLTLLEDYTLWGGNTLVPGNYTIWYDDLAALTYKIELANQYQLKGLGSWALGQEPAEVWPIIRRTLHNPILTDIAGHWAERQIMSAYEKGWMMGGHGLFRPDDTITRAEVAVILTRLCSLTDAARGPDFDDTATHWAAKEIAIARRFGLLEGVGANRFDPDGKLTREQLAVLIDRTMQLSNAVDFNDNPFTDLTRAAHPWSYESIIKLYANGIFTGVDAHTFAPLGQVRRSEMAAVLDRISGFGISVGQISRARTPVSPDGEFGFEQIVR